MSRESPVVESPPPRTKQVVYRKPSVKSATLFVSLQTCTPACGIGCQCMPGNVCNCGP